MRVALGSVVAACVSVAGAWWLAFDQRSTGASGRTWFWDGGRLGSALHLKARSGLSTDVTQQQRQALRRPRTRRRCGRFASMAVTVTALLLNFNPTMGLS